MKVRSWLHRILNSERSRNQRQVSACHSEDVELIMGFHAAFLTNGVSIVANVGFELTTYVL